MAASAEPARRSQPCGAGTPDGRRRRGSVREDPLATQANSSPLKLSSCALMARSVGRRSVLDAP